MNFTQNNDVNFESKGPENIENKILKKFSGDQFYGQRDSDTEFIIPEKIVSYIEFYHAIEKIIRPIKI
jgi:hypothetical protein